MDFSTARLQPGYDIEEVDGFVEAIRQTLLAIRQPPLTPDEVRYKQFSTTCLRPGYDQGEVDAFLDIAELRLAAVTRAERKTVARQIAFDLQGAELFYTTESARPHFEGPNDS